MNLKLARYDPEKYWEERISKDFSLEGVGFLGLGVEYNKYLYKARIRALSRLLKERRVNPRGKRILDIGVGTGFYIDYWKDRGANSIVGLDIAEKSISCLRARYPEYEFMKADIASKKLPIEGQFDIITAFDVLFHIVVEDEFEQAIKNIVSLCHEETMILVTDSFLQEPRPAGFHESHRTLDRYQEVLRNNGVRMIELIPIFYFMNNPIDTGATRNRFLQLLLPRIWVAIRWIIRLRNKLGLLGRCVNILVGSILYLVDGIILKYARRGPSTKLMLAQLEEQTRN